MFSDLLRKCWDQKKIFLFIDGIEEVSKMKSKISEMMDYIVTKCAYVCVCSRIGNLLELDNFSYYQIAHQSRDNLQHIGKTRLPYKIFVKFNDLLNKNKYNFPKFANIPLTQQLLLELFQRKLHSQGPKNIPFCTLLEESIALIKGQFLREENKQILRFFQGLESAAFEMYMRGKREFTEQEIERSSMDWGGIYQLMRRREIPLIIKSEEVGSIARVNLSQISEDSFCDPSSMDISLVRIPTTESHDYTSNSTLTEANKLYNFSMLSSSETIFPNESCNLFTEQNSEIRNLPRVQNIFVNKVSYIYIYI